MDVGKYIDLKIFIISFSIGLFFVYILGSDKKVIYVYPNPTNINDYIVQDKTNNCFKYNYKEVNCPTDTFSIKQAPMQE